MPEEVTERINRAADASLEIREDDSEKNKARKIKGKKELLNYKRESYYIPDDANNDNDAYQDRRIYIEEIDGFLRAANMTYKTFIEFCMEENEDISVEQYYGLDDTPLPHPWVEITWPTELMAEICRYLDAMSDKGRKIIDFNVDRLLPAAYWPFRKKLEEPSGEFGQNKWNGNEDHRFKYCSKKDKEYDDTDPAHPKLRYRDARIRVMNDRICDILDLISGGQNIDSSEFAQMGIHRRYNSNRTNKPRRYWNFRLEEIKKITMGLKLTPHWILVGNKRDVCVLAKKPETENIMDKIMVLSEQNQWVILYLSAAICDKESTEGISSKIIMAIKAEYEKAQKRDELI